MSDEKKSIFARIVPADPILKFITNGGKVRKKSVDLADYKKEKIAEKIDVSGFHQIHKAEMKQIIENVKDESKHGDIIEDTVFSMANFIANVGTFGDQENINLSAVVMRMLESIETLDSDIIEIIEGYYAIIEKAYDNENISSAHLDVFCKEMQSACDRYFEKHKELNLMRELTNEDLLYVSENNMSEDEEGASDSVMLGGKELKQPDLIAKEGE